ncbi:MAG: hypothetical protein MUC65_01435 [Pontiellaceae bacterium]|jgi:hypothetical protein|nr:hypothetical protein [Pontiellaceae bacterium]
MSALLNMVESEKKSIEKNLRISMIISAALVILVVAETAFISYTFHTKLTPENVAVMALDAVSGQIPALNSQLLLGAEQNAPILADQFVAYAIDTIRSLQPMMYDNLNVLTDQLMSEVKLRCAPVFQKTLLDLYADIEKNREKLTDRQFVKEAIGNLLDLWQEEFQKQLDEGFNPAVNYMNDEMSILLAIPDQELTKKNAAERQLLACSHILIQRLAPEYESISAEKN